MAVRQQSLGVHAPEAVSASADIELEALVLAPWHFVDPVTRVYSDNPMGQAWCADAGFGFATWSRGGQQAAFVVMDGLAGTVEAGRRGAGVWRFDARTRQLAWVTDCPLEGGCAFPSFSVDGGSIAYTQWDKHFPWDEDFFDTRRIERLTADPVSHLVAINLSTGAQRRADPRIGNVAMTGW